MENLENKVVTADADHSLEEQKPHAESGDFQFSDVHRHEVQEQDGKDEIRSQKGEHPAPAVEYQT